eukprot:SAG22_NODE_629_length_8389_cov_6.069723_2_plen_276_part_00
MLHVSHCTVCLIVPLCCPVCLPDTEEDWQRDLADAGAASTLEHGTTAAYLGQIHIMALANILRRPILFLDTLQQLLFLPLRHPPPGPGDPAPPIAVGYSSEARNHFVALVPLHPPPPALVAVEHIEIEIANFAGIAVEVSCSQAWVLAGTLTALPPRGNRLAAEQQSTAASVPVGARLCATNADDGTIVWQHQCAAGDSTLIIMPDGSSDTDGANGGPVSCKALPFCCAYTRIVSKIVPFRAVCHTPMAPTEAPRRPGQNRPPNQPRCTRSAAMR